MVLAVQAVTQRLLLAMVLQSGMEKLGFSHLLGKDRVRGHALLQRLALSRRYLVLVVALYQF